MLQSLITNIRHLKWGNAVLELMVVAVGILMAFQADRWWEARDDRATEQEYIGRLIVDLEKDIEDLTFAVNQAALRHSFATLLMNVAEQPELALEKPVDFIIAVNQAAFTYTPSLTSNTFEELRSTGNVGLLLDIELRNLMFDYYRFDATQRQYIALNHMQEFRHFELGAGVLSNRQLREAHLSWRVVRQEELVQFRKDSVEEAEVLAAARRLQANTEFVAWLPIAHEMQLGIGETNQDRMNLANAMLDKLRESARTGH
jgi:hypothetical protein